MKKKLDELFENYEEAIKNYTKLFGFISGVAAFSILKKMLYEKANGSAASVVGIHLFSLCAAIDIGKYVTKKLYDILEVSL